MANPVQIVSGLGGAIGCAYRQSHNQLVFVEFNGKLSRYDLFPSAVIVSSGTTVLKGTWTFDFDTGVQGPAGTLADIWWEQMTNVARQMVPQNNARIANLGVINFNSVTPATLQSVAYSNTPIPGNNDPSNKLVPGDVFAALTNKGNYAKVKVVAYGYDLTIQWVTYRLNSGYAVLGSGYNQPEDVKVSADGIHAYVTERAGNLLRVNLNNASRAAAQVISSGMTAPHQIVLDEAHHVAYVVEFAPAVGRILRIDLSGSNPPTNHTPVATGLQNAVGLAMTADGQFAYVTEQTGGKLTRIRLSTGNREELITGLKQPFFLTWAAADDHALLTTERDPANKVVWIDLTKSPATFTELATVATRPSSVTVVGGDELFICSDQVISELDLSLFKSSDPIFMGIGHVPASCIGPQPNIPAGMATTDPAYFFHVVDAPFGGTLPIMFNHDAARTLSAAHYRILVDGTEQAVVPFSDYRWNSGTQQFDLLANPDPPALYYHVRAGSEVWYNPWLGGFVNSTAFSNGLHTIAFRLFNAAFAEIGSVNDPGRSIQVLIDNGLPIAKIEKILHAGVEVPVCAIEKIAGNDNWTFQITARDAEKHLLSWSLGAVWGDNKSKSVASGTYAHVPSGEWEGLPPDPNTVPAAPWQATVSGDPTSTNCAHTFTLYVWDRVIDGWNYIHRSDYTKSITIMP
jgi:hypothetical protein